MRQITQKTVIQHCTYSDGQQTTYAESWTGTTHKSLRERGFKRNSKSGNYIKDVKLDGLMSDDCDDDYGYDEYAFDNHFEEQLENKN